ncbi:MAG: alpha/beta fold hydrolase [Candidatus Moranbacteria bacterium]|nr:alpha/beta fold hydrolase [Candidatus Moranbacteria bacterium]
MVQRLVKFVGKAAGKAKSVLFADPRMLYEEERQFLNQPFFFAGQNGKGVLLVHGWTSTPYELRRLGKYLNENGYTVLGIQLTGHGTVPKDIEDVKWSVWMNDIKNGYAQLKKTCDKVYIGGTSIGAVLTMMMAKENPEIAGIILMATPYKIRQEKLVTTAAKIAILFGQKYRKKFYPPTFGISSTITRLISYQTYPIKSALETFDLIKETRKNLDKIMQPCLLMQSTHDHVVEKNSMENIYNEIGSEIKKKIYIEKAYHTFISDIKNEHIFMDILEFLDGN